MFYEGFLHKISDVLSMVCQCFKNSASPYFKPSNLASLISKYWFYTVPGTIKAHLDWASMKTLQCSPSQGEASPAPRCLNCTQKFHPNSSTVLTGATSFFIWKYSLVKMLKLNQLIPLEEGLAFILSVGCLGEMLFGA